MRVRRLGWAGVEIESGDRRLVIDYVRDLSPMFTGWTAGAGLTRPGGEVDAALVTHLHGDHTDAAAIADVLAPGAPVLRPPPDRGDEDDTALTQVAERELAAHRPATELLDVWDTRTVGPFRVTAVPAVDGFGDPQVSWVVEADGRRVFHGGDTLFHGYWWHVTRRFAPLDAAFLPVNGVVVDAPLRQPPSRLPAAMDPRQAAEAARILGARHPVPMHYEPGQPDELADYTEVDDPAGEFLRHTGGRARVLPVGEWLDLAPGTADPLDAAARDFIEERDSFYAATVGETGWPYIQHRGGPPGFVHVLDESTIAFADVRGNRQYVTAGNLTHDGRIALFFMDYARRRRLKLLGTATVFDGAAHPELAGRLDERRTPGRVEHLVVIDVQGYDWNCPHHITPRFDTGDMERAGLVLPGGAEQETR